MRYKINISRIGSRRLVFNQESFHLDRLIDNAVEEMDLPFTQSQKAKDELTNMVQVLSLVDSMDAAKGSMFGHRVMVQDLIKAPR